jgi:hypothetical protein
MCAKAAQIMLVKLSPEGYALDGGAEWVMPQLRQSRWVRLVRHMTTMSALVASGFDLNLE